MAILTYLQVQNLMRQVGFPENQIVLGAAVFRQESSFNTDIIGTISPNEYSVGIGQINTKAHKNYSVEQLKNPQINLTEALRIYKNDLDRSKNHKYWRSWGGFTDGGYKKYLALSQAAYAGSSAAGLKTVNAPGAPIDVSIYRLSPVAPVDRVNDDSNTTATITTVAIGAVILYLILK